MLAMELMNGGIEMTRMTATGDVQKVPTWLWTSVGVLLLATFGALGAVGTWLMVGMVQAKVDVATHSQQIGSHESRIADLESVFRQLDAIRESQAKILQKLDAKN